LGVNGVLNGRLPGGSRGRRALTAAVTGCLLLIAVGGLSCTNAAKQVSAPGTTAGASTPARGAKATPAPVDRLSGLCFSPYTQGTPASDAPPGTADRLLGIVAPYTDSIRTFGSTGTAAVVASAAKAMKLKVALGADIESDPTRNDVEVAGLIGQARAGKVDLAVIGEESLYFNFVDEQKLIDYINRVKATGVPTTTSETWGELINHPRVVAACDLLVANMFPYWENVGIAGSIKYLESSYKKTKAAAGNKEVIIETGWPSGGARHGAAVASPENAAYYLRAFTAWARAHKVRYFYFEAFDEPWKAAHEGEVGAHWGIWDTNGQLKPGMAAAFPPR
jgi:exo-beta-1,3-glucanase (GH17 family)